jgi:hypothetical protein
MADHLVHGMSPWITDVGVGFQIWMLAENILNNQLWTADQGGPPTWGFGMRLTTSHCKNIFVQKYHIGPGSS